MPIVKTDEWNRYVEINNDPYGKACVDVARSAMEMLDELPEGTDFDCHKLIDDADDKCKAGGITGFMAGCAAQMISQVHSRGEEFRRKWNLDNQIGTEGEKANESGGILNPAILNIG